MLDYLGHRVMRPDPDLYWEYNYGLDRVRFPSPLISGTPMTLTYEVVSAEPKDKGLLMKYRATVVSAGATKPGMVAEWLAMVMPRTTGTFRTKSRTQEKEARR
jgi:acyl dehydratase